MPVCDRRAGRSRMHFSLCDDLIAAHGNMLPGFLAAKGRRSRC